MPPDSWGRPIRRWASVMSSLAAHAGEVLTARAWGTSSTGGNREKLDALAKIEARGEKSVGRGGSIPKRGGDG